MSIRIITDSASDLPQDYRQDVTVLPMEIIFGDEIYKDGVDLSHQTFYEKLVEGEELPKTSQVTPYAFETAYEEAAKKGEKIIVITLSSRLSGTYQSAVLAAQDYLEHVILVDSENVSVGEKALVQRALDLIDEGKTAEEIAACLEKEKKQLHVVALLDTLEYLKRGGRISSAIAAVGGILSIKPVVGVVDGQVALLGKSRGSKNGHNLLIEQIQKNGGIDFSRPYFLGYTGLSDVLLKKYIEDSHAIWEEATEQIKYASVGATIGTHVGPGAIVVAFFGKI